MDIPEPPHEGGGSGVLRVCHLIHNLQSGGAEESLVTLGRAARSAGIEIEVLSLTRAERSSVAAQLASAGVRVTSLELSTRWDPRALVAALGRVRERRPDVLHTHLKHADLVGRFVAERLHIPMVSTLHVVEDGPSVIGRAKRALGMRARRGAAFTIAVSDAQRDWYLREFGYSPSVVTVRNGVPDPGPLDPDARADLRRSFGAEPEEVLAVNVSIMRPGKGHADILALADAIGSRGGVRFVLVGDGELRPALEARGAAAAATAAPVVFAGYRDDAAAILAAADVVVHPSYADALPTALLHAIAAGRPTIAFDVGGVAEIVTPEAGILLPRGDRAALTAAVLDLGASPEKRERLGRGARARFEEEFTVERWLGRLRAVYERALTTAAGTPDRDARGAS